MSSPVKMLLPVAGVGGIGVGGGYYLLSDSTTVRDKLKEEVKRLPRRILDRESLAEWQEWKKVYKESSSKIEGVADEEQLPKWCVDTLSQKFDQSKYDLALTWCVVNISTLSGEAASKGVRLLSTEGNGDKFKEAWQKLKTASSTETSLTTTYAELLSSTVSDKNAGGPKLLTWCKDRYSWPMYKLNAKSTLSEVERWCNETQGNA
ncbi:hypothetical protein HF1_13590 [Mycoplasma haemofelis str. Langford 1]|uniref:Uncharacterized protein n=1 Tax=Mycoplasma haemofelis (strain Langford 1) TaxID=941640 RepID=E8ZJP6_MYCHL|nr:hypothetical protein [Mycoplasma haemofelis]CBY93367.1 hypothetical protein HF1_13590 [Mycoplasma haemofelis str. Langford 1]